MEPVPPTRTVRRTVRMAVSLVVGQALLCLLIGWLTLGRSSGSAPVDEMAAPPRTPPPTVAGRHAEPGPSAPLTAAAPSSRQTRTEKRDTGGGSKHRPHATRPAIDATPPAAAAPPSPAPSTGLPAPAEPGPTDPASPVVAPSTSTSPIGSLVPPLPVNPTLPADPAPSVPPLPSIPSIPGLQAPVVVGELCDPAGAFGLTAGGTLVRCLRTWHYRSRWKIV